MFLWLSAQTGSQPHGKEGAAQDTLPAAEAGQWPSTSSTPGHGSLPQAPSLPDPVNATGSHRGEFSGTLYEEQPALWAYFFLLLNPQLTLWINLNPGALGNTLRCCDHVPAVWLPARICALPPPGLSPARLCLRMHLNEVQECPPGSRNQGIFRLDVLNKQIGAWR